MFEQVDFEKRPYRYPASNVSIVPVYMPTTYQETNDQTGPTFATHKYI